MLRMPFGKHKGQALEEIPDAYLWWVLENCTGIRSWLRGAIERRLAASQPEAINVPSSAFEKIIRAWHREMTMRHHPDRGGSHEGMIAVNTGAELFRELAKQLGGAA